MITYFSTPTALLNRLRQPVAGIVLMALTGWSVQLKGAPGDWGVGQTGAPGIYTWQNSGNWKAAGQDQSPLAVPNGIGDIANLHLLDIRANQTINLDGSVTLGTLNLGDTSGRQSFILAAGAGGSLILNGGAGSAINKTGLGTDVISAPLVLTGTAPLTIGVAEGMLALTGAISGSGGFTKTGEGTLILRGTSSYTGVTTISQGMILNVPTVNDGAVLGAIGAGNGTVVSAGATLAFGPDLLGSGGIGNPAEPVTISGNGFRNNGALRFMMGANSMTFNGAVTFDGPARIQGEPAGTFTLSAAMNLTETLSVGGVGFVSFSGLASGSADINHFGINGFRLIGVGAGQSYSGTINSSLGEIRADTGNATLANTPYNDLTALNLKDSLLRVVFGATAGAPTAGDTPNSKFSTTAPISMSSSAIFLENSAFSSTSTNLFDYAVIQGFGTTTLTGGFNRIGMRSADTGSIALTFADIQRPNPGTLLELHLDSLVGAALGTSSKHQILNTALETAGVNVPFLGGWAYSAGGTANPEFLKYNVSALGGFGYTPMVAADYAVDSAVGTWASGDHIKITNGNRNITANTVIQSLNIQSSTARTLSGDPGATLEVGSGGILTSLATHTITVPFLTAGAASNYELYDIAWSTNVITSDVTDNGGNAVSLIKAGTGTTSFLTGNSYTGTTFINEGQFRGVIGSQAAALGSGNLTFAGSPNSQATFENDGDFTRALGSAPGEVQFLGGGGAGSGSAGFSAFGAPIDVNFGGAGAEVVWGSPAFNPGIFTLNGGNATHVVTLVNPLDLGGEQRYIRLDGSGSGTERAVIGVAAGDIHNGGIVKRGGGTLVFDAPKSYENGTIVNQGGLWLRGAGTAGADVIGNDIQVAPDGYLRIESPDNIGSHQMIILQNSDVNTPAAISFGAGYGDGNGIVFSSLTGTGGIPGTGGNNVLIVNNQSGQARRVAVTISGNNDFQNDIPGQIRAVAPNVESWFGADNGNGIFTGTSLTPSGGAVSAYRLGGHTNNGGVLTIANANVLTDDFLGAPTPLIVGAPDQTDRNYTDGTVYIPKAQGFSGQVTIGQGGVLHVGANDALGTGTADILLRAGELRLDVLTGNYGGAVGTQYAARNLNIAGGTSTIRTSTLFGGGFNTVVINNLTLDANRTLQVLSIGTNFTDLAVNNIDVANAAGTLSFTVGNDNSFQAGAGMLTVNGIIGDQATGAQSIQKNNGGVLILNSDNTYDGTTTITQGRVVLSNTGAAGIAGSTINLTTNSDRTAQLEFRINGSGPFLFDNAVVTAGGNDGSDRLIAVGPTSPGSENQTVQFSSLTVGHAGTYVVGGADNSAIFFDGFNGYQAEITGNVVLNRSISFRPRGALTTFSGTVSGAAANALEKNDQGALILNGTNTYQGTTTISNGYLVAGNDSAFGNATSAITYRGTGFSQILASGERTITRGFNNTATGDVQTLGGLDAGAKLFSGNISLGSRGIALTAFTGGDTTFSGAISGGFGVDKLGNGTVILAPASGTGNSYTGTTTVAQGILVGQAQATSGSPFGTGAMSILDAEVRLQGLAVPAANSVTSSSGTLTVAGGARVRIDDVAADGFATEFNFGSLTRSGAAGTVTFVPGRGDLGGEEIFSFSSAPALANGIVGPWAVHAASATNNAANYVTTSGNSIVSATYGGTGDLDTAGGSTQVFNAGVTGGLLTAERSVFAFRTDANVDLAGFTLHVGDEATLANGGGMILNNGADIIGTAGSRIDIGRTALSIYVDDAAVSSLNVPIHNTRSNANNTLATVFTKFGPGTLEIGAVQQFEGNIELNRGTLSLTAPNVFPFFSNLNGTTGSVITMSPGTTINLNNNDQEFGNLAAVNPSNSFQFSAGTINLGSATLTVGREDGNYTFNGQFLGGAGSTLVKVGAGRLILDNINGNKPSSVETVRVDRGVLQTWLNDSSWATPTPLSSAIPSTATILLRGGEWEAYAIGDSTGNQQRIHIGNNVIHQGADSIMDSNRATGSGSNKLLVYNDLTLDKQRFLVTGGNTFIPRFDGAITLTNHARLQTDTQIVLAGLISDGGNGYTLNKIGSSDLTIGADNSANWSGGMVITGGTVFFGTRGLDDIRSPGTTLVPLATANAGQGDIIVNLGSALRITAPSNILTGQGQEVRVYGSERGSATRIDLLTDAPIVDYGLRSLTDGSISLGLSDGLWTTPINLSRLGGGQWGLSAVSSTFYTASTLGATVDNRYIFNGSAAGTLTITNSNVVDGTASVELGKSPVFAGGNPSGSGASIRFYGDQTYTGNTAIYRAADGGSIQGILELTGDSASPVFDVYGRLTLRGAGRVTNDAGVQVNAINLRPGGNLRLDYNMDVNDGIVTSRLNESNLGLESTENKWGDTTPILLDGAGINLINSSGRVNQETVGVITAQGGAGITLERNGTNGQVVLRAADIVRSGQSTLTVRENVNELGSINLQSMKLFTATTPSQTNGMVAPWMINATRRTFLSYNTTTGFTNAPFEIGTPAAGGGNAFLSGFTGTEIVQFSGGWGDTTLTGTKNVYALRVDEETSSNDMIFNGGQINIHSGGLIVGSDDGNRVDFNTTAIYFGDGSTPVEGIIYGGHSTPNTRFGGVVTADDLTLDGPGGFHFVNTANAITGTIQMNGGRMYLDGAGTQGTASEIIMHGNYANNFNGNQMPDLRLRHNSATTTFNNLAVTVAANVPVAQIQAERFSGSSTSAAVQIQGLNILGTDGPSGTLVRLFNSNSNTDVLGNLTIGGSSPVGLNVNTATWRVMGDVSSAAPIVKTGDGVLRWDGDNSAFTGGFTLNRGEWRLTAASTADYDSGGTGDVELNFGTVRMANTTSSAMFTAPGQDISVNGQITFIVDRNGGAAGVARTFGVNNAGQVFRTTNSPYVIFQAASFGDDTVLETQVEINGSPVFRVDSTDLFLRDVVSGEGTFNKAGINYLHFDNNAANTWTGGFNNFTGITIMRQANATLGTGPVQVFAGTGLSIASTTQLGTTGLTKIFTSGTALPTIGVRTIANFNAITAAVAAPGVIVGTGNGVLAIDANQSLATDPMMATRDGGVFAFWNLGSQDGNGNLTANSVTPWGAGGSEFLIGGGGVTLTVNPGTAGSNQFGGAGNRMILGVADTAQGWGTVLFGANANNDYDGGTLVTRSRNRDGGYRGTALSLQGGAVGTGTTFRTPLGSGQVDVFGEIRIEGASGTAVATGGLTNSNAWVFHGGSRLRFDNATPFTGSGTTGNQATGTIGGGGRWADGVGINLFSSVIDMVGDGTDHAANKEIVGDITFAGGSEVVVRRTTGFGAELVTSNLFRSGTGTLMLRHDSLLLGLAGSVNTDRFIVSSGAGTTAGQVPVTNNMVDPWIVSRSENQFLKYDATLGFQTITQSGAPANYLTSAGGTLNGATLPLNDGTEILNLITATGVLGANLDIHALRTDRNIDPSTDGLFNRITIRSGGIIGAANTITLNPDLYFGMAGDGTGEALLWANTGQIQINGKIYASQVTKSGTNFLSIQSDQPQFTGDWVINGGGVQFLTPNAQSTGEVILNAAHMADNDSVFNLAEVRYNFNSGTPDLFTWAGGKITVNDMGIIRSVATADRLEQIPAVDLNTTGGGHEGVVFFQVDASRHTVRTGTITLNGDYMISVDATSFGPGSTSGIQIGAGNGLGGLNNQGLYNVRLTGDGVLSLGDNSASFTGSRTFSVGDGTARVLHNGAFGAATVTAYLRSTAAMEIAVANFMPTATLIQEAGSIERWARNDARGTGNYTLPAGVHLQLFTDVSGTRTIDLSGGSIMGYLPLDYDQVAVIQTIREGVTINLTADSFLGQIYPAGTSNGANHIFYDMGKLNTTTNLNPSDVGLRGSYLVIDGNITGNFDLTKLGQDVIKLAGSNSFRDLIIEGGIVQIGRTNALAATSVVKTRGEGTSGIFDLNGYDQEIAGLTGPSGSVNNSGFDFKTLTVNNSVDYTYGGSVNGSVTLEKQGPGKLTFTAVNEYQGGTVLGGGVLSVNQDASLGRVHIDTRPDSLRFAGGTLETTGNMSIVPTRGITLDATGGTISTSPSTLLEVASMITGSGSLTKAGAGTLQLGNAGNNYTGFTHIVDGTLLAGAADVLAPQSRHVVTGDAVSGSLNLNGFDQVVGSVATSGAVPGSASIILGANRLTLGADGTRGAVYGGAIAGSGVVRLSGPGAEQTLSGRDNSGEAWSTEIANGRLILANGVRLGAGAVTLGVPGVSGSADCTALELQGIMGFANAITVNNSNSAGSAFITAGSAADSSVAGTLTLHRDIFAGAAAGQQLSLEAAVSGAGSITVVDGGTLRLVTANSFGTGVTGGPGAAIDGGLVIRAGSVLLENSTGAGVQHIELGDATSALAAVDRATFESILGGGSFNPNGDGVSAGSGGQPAAGNSGFGAFIGVSSTLDGNTYTSGDVGTRLLIAGEDANPERNGIYTIVSVDGATMNLVRAADFQTAGQMNYGTQVAVTNGTYGGTAMFMTEQSIVVRNESSLEPIRFREDVLNGSVSLLQNVSGLTVANHIDINSTNGSGSISLGGSDTLTSGTGTFAGNVQLADLQAGVAESRTLTLTSATATSGGITFAGVISEADSTAGTGDTLALMKAGPGTITLTGGNTFRGATLVTEGRLQVGDGSGGSLLGNGNVSVTGAGLTLAAAPILAGGSAVSTVAGAVSIGTATNPGILAPGLTDSATSNQQMIFSHAGGIIVADASQIQMSITSPTLDAGDAVVASWLASGSDLNAYLGTNPSEVTAVNVAPGAYGDLDYINITNGTLNLGARASGPFGDGSLLVQNNGWTPVAGDVFNLFDWVSAMNGSFSVPGIATQGGAYGDLDLPLLTGDLYWDVSALTSHGVIGVTFGIVPEPSRALLLLLGLAALCLRRRRD